MHADSPSLGYDVLPRNFAAYLPNRAAIHQWLLAAIAVGLLCVGIAFVDTAFERYQTSLRELEYGQSEYSYRSRVHGAYDLALAFVLFVASYTTTRFSLSGFDCWRTATFPERVLLPIHSLQAITLLSTLCLLPLAGIVAWASVPVWTSVQSWSVLGIDYSPAIASRYWWRVVMLGSFMSAAWTMATGATIRLNRRLCAQICESTLMKPPIIGLVCGGCFVSAIFLSFVAMAVVRNLA